MCQNNQTSKGKSLSVDKLNNLTILNFCNFQVMTRLPMELLAQKLWKHQMNYSQCSRILHADCPGGTVERVWSVWQHILH